MSPRGRSNPGPGSEQPKYPGTFLLAFREAAESLGWSPRRWKGYVVECADHEGKEQTVGLENLFRRIRLQPREQWPSLIGEFLRTATDAEQEQYRTEDLASVAGQLLLRLGTPMGSVPKETKVWSHVLAGTGLHVNLVVDYPNHLSYVTEKLVEESGRPGEEWMLQALANLQERTPADCLECIDHETGMRLCSVADSYDSSRALLLDVLMPEFKADGFFVSIPGRDQLLVLPVNASGLGAVHFLRLMADKSYRNTPYPISDEVYWLREGQWHRFRVEIRGQQVMVEPPEEFAEILSRLSGEMDQPETESASEEP